MKGLNKNTSPAKAIALVGISAATVECAKLALSFLPNIEVVTLLVALFSYTFGIYGVMSAVIFVCIEPLIYGFGTWVVLYFIYWPTLALVFMILGKKRVKNRVILTLIAVVMTFLFGVLSALVDVGLLSGFFDKFFYRFAVYYARGIVFYAVQIACNAVIFPLLFKPLSEKLFVVKKRIFGSTDTKKLHPETD